MNMVTKTKRKRVRAREVVPGAVIGIATCKGEFVALVSHSMGVYGHVLRIFEAPLLREEDVSPIVARGQLRFTCVTMPGLLARDERCRKLGDVLVPPALQQLPVFRIPSSRAGRPVTWRFWDGSRNLGFASQLSDEQARYPIGTMLFVDALVRHIEGD